VHRRLAGRRTAALLFCHSRILARPGETACHDPCRPIDFCCSRKRPRPAIAAPTGT
jgi:hypothetical protein